MQCAWLLRLVIAFSLFLGVHVYSRYGSRYLAEKLSQFGFCKGYHEILRYKKVLLWHLRQENFSSMKTRLLRLLLTMPMIILQIWMKETQFIQWVWLLHCHPLNPMIDSQYLQILFPMCNWVKFFKLDF